MKLYVGNISYDVSEDELRQAFSDHGEVASVSIIKDKYTNRSKGFAFVEMPDKTQAETAITALNGKDLKGRALNISEARPRVEGDRGGDRGGDRNGSRDRGSRSGGPRRSW